MPKGIFKRTKTENIGKYIRTDAIRKKISVKLTGKKLTAEHRAKVVATLKNGEAAKGSLNHAWQGDAISYGGLHLWILKNWGKAETCEDCGMKRDQSKKKNIIHWANKDGVYNRSRCHWRQMCARCHNKFDQANPKTVCKK